MKLLHIDSSILEDNSVSRQITRKVVDQWIDRYPDTVVDYLDLTEDTPSHLSQASLGFRTSPTDDLPEAHRRENALSEALVSQFLAADVIVLGAPMYNFGIPSQVKAWIDRVAQAGRTFSYTAAGPKGLAGGKTVIVASTRGGMYSDSEAGRAMEHQESYLKTIFGFFGIADISIVRAEGLAMGDAAKAESMRGADIQIADIVSRTGKRPQETVVA